MKITHQDCWAKTVRDTSGREAPGITVRDHGLNVGCVAEALYDSLPNRVRKLLPSRSAVAILAALHDIGKVSPGFQAKCSHWLRLHPLPQTVYEDDHAKITQWFLQGWLGNNGYRLRRWWMALGAHHGHSKGEWIRTTTRPGIAIGNCGGLEWDQARTLLLQELCAFFDSAVSSSISTAEQYLLEPSVPGYRQTLTALLAGLVSIADWIGSNEHFFCPAVESPPLNPEERRRKAENAAKDIGFRPLTVRGVSFHELFPHLSEVSQLQRALVEIADCPGLYIVEGPMGCGKTEAALLAAAGLLSRGTCHGLYFGLPTQTTSNRIYERVEPFLSHLLGETAVLRLAHGSSWLQEKDTILIRPTFTAANRNGHLEGGNAWAAQMWFTSPRRALLAPFGVGTVDQALLGTVAAKHFFVRQFGLAGKVVVLDEIHSYDLYTSTLLDVLIEDLLQLRCTVVVLSATLTRRRREQLLKIARRVFTESEEDIHDLLNANNVPLLPYPLISGVRDTGEIVERSVDLSERERLPVRVHCAELSFEQQVAECARRADGNQVVFWIRNTVDQAQEAFRAIKGTVHSGGPEVVLLHSRYPWFRRNELEEEWLARLGKDSARRPRGCVVVATQVLEQSVDIDADFMLTELAPTDMLLQRVGRLWRHERRERPCPAPELWIHSPDCTGLSDLHEIVHRLRPHSSVYAPYVLLRSGREWARVQELRLPDDIRPLLERTYAPCTEEPSAWAELRQRLESDRDQHTGRAIVRTNRWSLPELPDDEGVQTRLNEYPTVQLVLLRELRALPGKVRLLPLDGAPVEATEREWQRDAARTLFRNTVRIPAWWLRDRQYDRPHALRRYFVGTWAWAQVDGECLWLNGQPGENSGLRYLPDRGVWCESPGRSAPNSDYENDEPCD